MRGKNPHLRFPLTNNKEKIAGKITYDKNGDILKIETLKWTDIARLQDFFYGCFTKYEFTP